MRTHHRPLVKVDLLGPAINRQSGWMFTGFLRLKKALEQKFRGRENPHNPEYKLPTRTTRPVAVHCGSRGRRQPCRRGFR